jgi:hypothetical protein
MNVKEEAEQATDEQLNEMIHSDSFLQRVNAMNEIGYRLQNGFDAQKLKSLIAAIQETRNQSQVTLGTISVSHIGMSALAKVEDARAKAAFENLLKYWNESDRGDLLWYLESEGVDTSHYQPVLQAA